MKIGVIGAGNVGTALAKRLALRATVVDAGPLENARYVEPAGFLLVRLAYGLGLGSRIGLSLLRSLPRDATPESEMQ
jgi:predicted dinucleotide-binding enzyme